MRVRRARAGGRRAHVRGICAFRAEAPPASCIRLIHQRTLGKLSSLNYALQIMFTRAGIYAVFDFRFCTRTKSHEKS